MAAEQIPPARTGAAMRLGTGDRLRVVNTHGTQVVDLYQTMTFELVARSSGVEFERSPAGRPLAAPFAFPRISRIAASISASVTNGLACRM